MFAANGAGGRPDPLAHSPRPDRSRKTAGSRRTATTARPGKRDGAAALEWDIAGCGGEPFQLSDPLI
jgi:hypothetical protein